MATIALYANKINNMPGLINVVKKSVNDYKSELSKLKNKALKVNKSICNFDDVISTISASTKVQEEKITSLERIQKDSEQFIDDVVHIDSDVADIIKERKNDFYDEYSYLKPDCEKGRLEKAWSDCKAWLKKAGAWCKEHWVMIVTAIVVIAIAIISVVTFGIATAAIAAIAGIVSLVLCIADVICMLATGGKSISDVCRENGMGWLGDIFDGISLGCDIVSIVFPAAAAIKTMAKVGVKAFAKGSIQAMKLAFKDIIEKVFKSGFKNGVKNLGKILFKTFIFDIDDFSRVNSSGKRVFDIFDHSEPIHIQHIDIDNRGGLNPDGSFMLDENSAHIYPSKEDGFEDGFFGNPLNTSLESGTRIDRYGNSNGYFVAPQGTPFENRSLELYKKDAPYNLFEVNRPINAKSGPSVPWFGQEGGGTQYKFEEKIIDLLKSGDLRIIDYPQITINGFIHWREREELEKVVEIVS